MDNTCQQSYKADNLSNRHDIIRRAPVEDHETAMYYKRIKRKTNTIYFAFCLFSCDHNAKYVVSKNDDEKDAGVFEQNQDWKDKICEAEVPILQDLDVDQAQ